MPGKKTAKNTPKKEEAKTKEPSAKTLKLYRSETDRVLAGVAGGLGEYFNLDPILIRLLFLLVFLSGPGLIIYLVLWAIIPNKSKLNQTSNEALKENVDEIKVKARALAENVRQETRKQNTRLWVGLFLVLAGTVFFLDNFGFFRFFKLVKFWPLLLIVFGAAILSRKENEPR